MLSNMTDCKKFYSNYSRKRFWRALHFVGTLFPYHHVVVIVDQLSQGCMVACSTRILHLIQSLASTRV